MGRRVARVAYYEPLIAQVRARNRDGQPVGRLEIPFTKNHWESFFVVAGTCRMPAAGSVRSMSSATSPSTTGPDVGEYHEWLLANGVRWIAIPDVTLDHAGVIEQH